MTAFRYQALQANGKSVDGRIEAADRRSALRLLSERGLFPSTLEAQSPASNRSANAEEMPEAGAASGFTFGGRIRRKDITSFTREMAALLEAGIPIPQALTSLAEEEENAAMRDLLREVAVKVRTGSSFSSALSEHSRQFDSLYTSMVQVGEEAGALEKVMQDLADLLEHEDEIRSEVVSAIAYPVFVLGFGIFTVVFLLTVVLPRLFTMMEEMMDVLPLPTLILLKSSSLFYHYWYVLLVGVIGVTAWVRWFLKQPHGELAWDRTKLKLPLLGPVFKTSALGRFARTLGTLVQSGVSLLPALKIVEGTIGNAALAGLIAQVSEETRGGDSLAAPIRKLGVFPATVVQMIHVGEETGQLDKMLLKVADTEERQMRARTKTLISLLAPLLILVVGALVGFMVIALLLPIFKMSQGIQ